MSRVFLAEETRLGRQVVIKVLPPETGAAVNVERFEREIQLAARLQHPHIVPLLTAGAAAGDLLYYVMPFIAGESLRAKLAREGELPVAEATKFLREIVDALAYAHRTRRRPPRHQARQRAALGRPRRGDRLRRRQGGERVERLVLAHLARRGARHAGLHGAGAGRGRSARGSPRRHLRRGRARLRDAGGPDRRSPRRRRRRCSRRTSPRRPSRSREYRPAVSPALNGLLMRCLEKRAADRWQSAAELLGQLEAAATPSGGLTPTGTMPAAISSGTEEAIRQSASGAGRPPLRRRLGGRARHRVLAGPPAGPPDWVLVRGHRAAADRPAHHPRHRPPRAPPRAGARERPGDAPSAGLQRLAHLAQGHPRRRHRVRHARRRGGRLHGDAAARVSGRWARWSHPAGSASGTGSSSPTSTTGPPTPAWLAPSPRPSGSISANRP